MELIETYQKRWDEWMLESDPRVADWPLMSSPIPTIIIVFCYVVGIRGRTFICLLLFYCYFLIRIIIGLCYF